MGGWQGIGKDRVKWDGNIVITKEPTQDNDVATKAYVDDNAGGIPHVDELPDNGDVVYLKPAKHLYLNIDN